MLTSLIHHLIKTINTKMKIIREQVQLIQFLLKIIFRSNLLNQLQSKAPSLEQPTDLNFQKFRVDELPTIEETEKLDFRILLAEYKDMQGKDLKPVQHKIGKQLPSNITCPHCQHTLSHIKTRTGFTIYKCVQEDSPYYVHRLNEPSDEEHVLFKQKPYEFKMHYIYREFDLPFSVLS